MTYSTTFTTKITVIGSKITIFGTKIPTFGTKISVLNDKIIMIEVIRAYGKRGDVAGAERVSAAIVLMF